MKRLLLCVGLILGLAFQAHAQDDHPILSTVRAKLKDPAKPFCLVVNFKIKAGMDDKVKEVFTPYIKDTRQEKGNLAYQLNKSMEDEVSYVVYEKWANFEAMKSHMSQDYTTKFFSAIGASVDGAPDIKVFLPVAE
jgi:quinol monooxygenase YgiN